MVGDLGPGRNRAGRKSRQAGPQRHRNDKHQRRPYCQATQAGRELLPQLTTIAILVREASPTAAQYVKECQAAARNLGIALTILNERDPGDIDRLFSTIKLADALVIADDAEFTADRARIADLALKMRLPTISGLKELAEAGGLIA